MSENKDTHFDVEAKLKQTRKELQEVQDEFQNLIYIIAHDLRGPLRHASGFGEMLLSINKDVLNDKSKKFLKIIVDSAEAGKRSLDSLQNYSRIIFRDLIIEEGIDPNTIVEDVNKTLAEVITDKKAEIQCSNFPLIKGDRAQLTQLFECLLRNALLYHIQGAPVTILVKCQAEKDAWHFSITDNGIGLSNAHLEFVFGVFKRAVKDTDYPGEGMGLTIAKKIVEQHDGRIWFSPDLSKGAEINFTISRDP
jgi:light-regulated signal transduction histidine kinase (bacteriophytochrome)